MWDGRKKRKVSLWGRWAKTWFFFLFDLRLVAIFCSKRLVFACQNAARPSQLEKMSSNVWQSFVLRSKCLLNMWNPNLFAQTFASTMGLGALRRFDTSAARKKQTDDQDGFLTFQPIWTIRCPLSSIKLREERCATRKSNRTMFEIFRIGCSSHLTIHPLKLQSLSWIVIRL